MWIIKIGGSWITNPNLNKLITLLSEISTKNIVIIAGGGYFSDSVRLVYSKNNMSEKTGHYIALKATEMFSYIIREIDSNFELISDINSLKKKNNKIKIWMPSQVLKNEISFDKTWESTSDSVAAWLHKEICSQGLLFVKSLKLEKNIYKLSHLQKRNILDENVDKYLFGQKNIKIVGPDIIDLLNENLSWGKLFKKFKEVEF